MARRFSSGGYWRGLGRPVLLLSLSAMTPCSSNYWSLHRSQGGSNGTSDLRRVGTDGAATPVTASDVGSSADSSLWRVTVDDRGMLWAALLSSSGGFEGLFSHDGQASTTVPFDGEPGLAVTDVAVSPAGMAWVTVFDRQAQEISVASWDGQA